MKIEEDRNRVVDPHDWDIDACENLANKIIENACNDFRAAYADTFPRDSSKNSTCVAVENFFHSPAFRIYTSLDPDALIEDLKKEVEERFLKRERPHDKC